MHAPLVAMLAAQLVLLATAAANHTCDFTLDSLEFNLCPLFLGKSTSFSRTWLCLTVENTVPGGGSESKRILRVVPVAGNQGLNPRVKLLEKAQEDDLHQPLQLTLHGGLYNKQPQRASFQFHCDYSLDEPTLPKFFWLGNGTHTFTWRTKHACPKALPPGAPGPKPAEPDTDPPVNPPDDPDTDADVTHPTVKSVSTLLVLFWISLSVIGLRYLYPSLSRWGRVLRSRFSIVTRNPMARSKGFRPSAISLVQRAAEEAPEEYGVDDGFMQSFSDGEETPLTANSRASFAASQYGSAG
ncbi:hypothetical protein B0H12DRAFT_1145625 [Mycena haematopus]|nr:hypothetical protein B0H12DRAFT_1145625 [Mycena haematopus]